MEREIKKGTREGMIINEGKYERERQEYTNKRMTELVCLFYVCQQTESSVVLVQSELL
jgi:hypothetical protein